MSGQTSVCHSSDRAEAEAINFILEQTRNKVEIAVRLPALTAHGHAFLQTSVNITDDEIALLARIYVDVEMRDLEESVSGDGDTQIPAVDRDDLDEQEQVRSAMRILSSNANVWKLIRENRREMSPKAITFVSCGGKYQYGSEPSFSQNYFEEQDKLAWSKSTPGTKVGSSRSSSTPKIKRTIRRYEPRTDQQNIGTHIRQPHAKASDESNAELLKFYNNLQNNALQVRDHQLQMEKLIKKHLLEEKHARAEKDKAELELLTCLKEYDREVGTLQAQLEGESSEFEEEKRQMVVLEENFKVQQILYEQLMAEKLAEYQRELKEKMFIFVCNRAALRIQRYWRSYRERKMAKKKRKGRKGKAGSGGKTTKN